MVDHGALAQRELVGELAIGSARRDVDAIMALMTEDCLFENTPSPDGERYAGAAVPGFFWARFFAGSPQAHFAAEQSFAAGVRCVARWRYTWRDTGGEGQVGGVDRFRVRDGKAAEKLAYVKG